MKFKRTEEIEEKLTEEKELLSMSFDETPFSVAMSSISSETGKTIVWGMEADATTISGVYTDVSITNLLLGIARRYKMQLVDLGDDVYYIGTGSRSDIVSIVIRAPITDIEKCVSSLQNCCSEFGKVSAIGNCIVIADYLDQVKKIRAACERIREKSARSYVAEVYFLRMKNSELLDLQARLEAKNIDLLSCSINMKNLFSMYTQVTGNRAVMSSETRPIVYLSEGREGTFQVGSERTRERKAVSGEGYVTTTGYETVTDGMTIKMKVTRITPDLLACDFDLSISTFGELDDNKNPIISKSALTLPGVVVRDSGVYFLGSVKQKEDTKGLGLFTINTQKTDELITVWLKIREFGLQAA